MRAVFIQRLPVYRNHECGAVGDRADDATAQTIPRHGLQYGTIATLPCVWRNVAIPLDPVEWDRVDQMFESAHRPGGLYQL